jgi:hypothetical protein
MQELLTLRHSITPSVGDEDDDEFEGDSELLRIPLVERPKRELIPYP